MPGDHVPGIDGKTTDYLYLSIYKAMKERILGGEFQSGDRFPPERQLKDEYNTTHVTVRKALSLLVEEGYIERYSGRGTVVVFSPEKTSIQSNVHIRPRSVRFLVPYLDEHHQQILMELRRRCQIDGVTLHVSVFLDEWEEAMFHEAISDRSSLLIYEPHDPSFRYEPFLPAIRNRVVLLGGYGYQNSISTIRYDIHQAVQSCITFLRNLGSGEIAFIGWNGSRWGDAMRAAFTDIMKSNAFSSDLLISNGMGLREGGTDAARSILSSSPNCRSFICANDLSAGGVLNHLEQAGYRSGKDFTVIGCGTHPFSEVIDICSLDFNSSRISRVLRGILDDYYNRGVVEPSESIVPLELVLRGYAKADNN